MFFWKPEFIFHISPTLCKTEAPKRDILHSTNSSSKHQHFLATECGTNVLCTVGKRRFLHWKPEFLSSQKTEAQNRDIKWGLDSITVSLFTNRETAVLSTEDLLVLSATPSCHWTFHQHRPCKGLMTCIGNKTNTWHQTCLGIPIQDPNSTTVGPRIQSSESWP